MPQVAAPQLPADVARWLEIAEARAILDTWDTAAAQSGNTGDGRTAWIAGAGVGALTCLDFWFFNRCVGLGVDQPATREDVAAIAAWYPANGRTQSAVQVSPVAVPSQDEIGAWLENEGYARGSNWVKLWHDLADVEAPSSAHRIEAIGQDRADIYMDICLTAFEMPPIVGPAHTPVIGRPGWSHYIGYEGGTAVSVAAMRIDEGVAWLGFGGTLEEHRGKGWQTAMFRRRLADAKAAGCWLATTETGEETDKDPVNPSYRNMLRTGFRLGYARRNWYRIPAEES